MYCQATDHYVVEAGTQVNAPEGVYFTYVDYGWYSAGSFNTDWDEVNDTVWTLSDPDVSYTLLMSDGSFISFYASRNGIINNSGNTYDENATGAGGRFMDVTPDAYYHDPVEWAVEKGITVGTSDTTFSPDTECTRGQILTFLWRAAGCPPHYMGSSPITDIAVTDYYYDAVLWAYANGILDTKFGFADPNAPCTRAMTVQFLWLFGGAQYMEDAAPFTDVPASADYAMAVAWALENGITAGTSETTFSPGSTCTRGQIVTFLELVREQENLHLTLTCSFVGELKIDQSISHNGVCLTVVKLTENTYTVTAMKETLERSNLGLQKVGDKVNVERSMMMNGRLDGHIVQGHVDETAECVEVRDAEGSWYYTFRYKKDEAMAAKGYMTVDKGSVCVNGVSLTVCNPTDDTFTVAIIPYTYEHTNFHTLEVGSVVNIEFDIIGKYIARMLKQ